MKSVAPLLLCLTALTVARAADTVIYKTVGDRQMKLLVDKPADWQATDQRPAVVFFFGGGWVGGTPGQFEPQSQYLATRGLVGVRVEYRVIPRGDAGPPTVCCNDAKSALRYVRAHAAELGIDPARIAAAGGSAGGHLAAFTGLVDGIDDPADDLTVSCRPAVLLLFNPVLNNGPDGGWGYQRVGARYREFSPAHNVSKAAPPTIIFLGDDDKLIPVATMKSFEADMQAAGVRCELHVYPGVGHGFFNRDPHRTQTLVEVDQFLASLGWLTGPPTLPEPPAG
ncbi:MAG: alpha/beta hydrolase fold domain-containing protein [Armatimonadetes bacterium]|nr:alpha/beta hydrolase fold domain-containing protein [Armatimonadota bacterium]